MFQQKSPKRCTRKGCIVRCRIRGAVNPNLARDTLRCIEVVGISRLKPRHAQSIEEELGSELEVVCTVPVIAVVGHVSGYLVIVGPTLVIIRSGTGSLTCRLIHAADRYTLHRPRTGRLRIERENIVPARILNVEKGSIRQRARPFYFRRRVHGILIPRRFQWGC